MTLPNVLTLVRIGLAPLIFGFVIFGWTISALVAYLVGLWTDFIDGMLARRTGASSAFGRAMDSTADKALVGGGLLGLMALGEVSATLVFAFLYREFIVFGLRAIRPADGVAVAQISDVWGRIRFFVLHVGVVLLLLPASRASLRPFALVTIWASVGIAYAALIHYLIRDRRALRRALQRDAPP